MTETAPVPLGTVHSVMLSSDAASRHECPFRRARKLLLLLRELAALQ
jgi:hypothetical protein